MTGLLSTALTVATAACAVANVAIAAADVARAGFVVTNSTEVGLSATSLPYLAVLKGAGAAGLVVGLVAYPALGLAAAVGLTLFYLAAIGAHVRARVFHNIAYPTSFCGLAMAAVAHFVTAV